MLGLVPKLWNETIDEHRSAVRAAAMETTAALAAAHGLRAVTMSRIASEAGIGRATLYKYFPDVEAILLAWHETRIDAHLRQLADVRDAASGPQERLAAVLEAYALIDYERHGQQHNPELVAFLHQDEHVAQPRQRLARMIEDLLADAAEAGAVRDDVAARELANYCLHALGGASILPSRAAVRRLVALTLAGTRPTA
jgi:AcrR family transcriptional regulator